MRFFIAFDDTDVLGADRGTGKIGRWFEDKLPEGCRLWGVVRQQLLVHPDVPYTSHNSSAVVVVGVENGSGRDGGSRGEGSADTSPGDRGASCAPDPGLLAQLFDHAVAHLAENWMEGSDPGLCIAWQGCAALPALAAFGRRAAVEVVTQEQAHAAAAGAHLSGHGGTQDGVIGAAAGVGLTADGWSGRLIEYRSCFGHLRDIPDPVSVADLGRAGITVVSLDRDAPVPLPDQLVDTQDWLRPRLWAGRPVLPVQRGDDGHWTAVGPRTLPEGAETE
jgi:tRNA(Ile2) C34 agmatinyltransferase TiaS